MSETISPLAGKPAPESILVDVPKLLAAYTDDQPDPSVPAQRIAFGTSGHRGSSLERSFNACHVLAITQAICDYRKSNDIDGPLFIGIDTHALSLPAFESALEVLAANRVTTMIAPGGEYTPTPAVSLAILNHNRDHSKHLADGIVVTPSHNPPDSGGFKYNPPNGGPAETDITDWIEKQANSHLERKLAGVKRMPIERARHADTTFEFDFLDSYVADLANVIDFDAIRGAGISMGVDPLGGAGVHYWAPIAQRYKLDLSVVSDEVDPTFRFMTVDWDGRIRMDPSSRYAMQRLIGLKDKYDIAFACDTDHDRHGIVARGVGLMTPNEYLSVLAEFLFHRREGWSTRAAIGKTVVTTALIDRVAARAKRTLYETPVGFKWFSAGLLDGSLGFGCEESAGASVLRRDGSPWTTDKDGIVPALLAAELMAVSDRDPAETYQQVTTELGRPWGDRVQAPANGPQRAALKSLHAGDLTIKTLAGEKVTALIDHAPGNNAPIGGIRVSSASGWFAARPSGTEDIYKVYAESFRDETHLQTLLDEAQNIVDEALRNA
ncbi:MAG: phosphoglucomutase (alpha-D-glucose-1,6-bisphosphate-dependent) [Arenicellales bacterium]